MVYLIQNSVSGYIKVGCSRDIKTRLSTLQTGSANKLTLIGYGFGDRQLEKAIHVEFSDCRVIGEWFRPSKTLVNLALSINAMRLAGYETRPSDIEGFRNIEF